MFGLIRKEKTGKSVSHTRKENKEKANVTG